MLYPNHKRRAEIKKAHTLENKKQTHDSNKDNLTNRPTTRIRTITITSSK